jgi:myo-inositol 2-dehydrogenase/D-chiro-inositol 1-dehydrogenase
MSPDAALRVGVIGCGPIGTLHAEAVCRSPLASLVGVCDVDRGRAEGLASRLGRGVSACTRSSDLLKPGRIDVAAIATPDHLHVEVALEAIEAGCHVFCEKPLATSAAEARRLVEAADRRGVILGVDYNRRFGFGYRRARSLLDGGRLGSLQHLLIHVLDRTPLPDVARFPEVILTTLLTHHLDLARWFGGEVAAIAARFGPPDPSASGLRRDVVLSLDFEGGAVGAIVAGYRDGLTRTSERTEIVGSLGSVQVDDVTRAATSWTTDPDRCEVSTLGLFTGEAGFHATIGEHVKAFLESVAAGSSPPVAGLDGLRGLELAEAALRSHAEGRPIMVAEPSENPAVRCASPTRDEVSRTCPG